MSQNNFPVYVIIYSCIYYYQYEKYQTMRDITLNQKTDPRDSQNGLRKQER